MNGPPRVPPVGRCPRPAPGPGKRARRGRRTAAPYRGAVARLRTDSGSTGRWGTSLHLAAGLGVLGAAGYAYVAIVGHVFASPTDAALVSALISVYLLINIIGPGVFAALEQETSRSVSVAVAREESIRSIGRRAGVIAAGYAAATGLAVLVAWPLVLHRVLDGRTGLLAALLLAVAGSAGVYWIRGILGGRQRFAGYAATLYLEGGLRVLPCLVLLALAAREPAAYGLAFAAGSAVAAALLWPAARPAPDARAPADPDGMLGSMSLLFAATALGQLVANLAPVVVAYRLPGDAVTASVFAATFVLARIPLFLFAPVQAVLLPKLTRAATLGDRALLRRRLGQVLGAVAAVGTAGLVAGVLVGPVVAEVVFSAVRRPGAELLAALGVATLLMMAALVLQPALIALGRQRDVAAAWVAGTVVFVAALCAPVEPVAAALAAQALGPAVVAGLLAVRLRAALRACAPAAHPDATNGTLGCT